MKRFLLLLLLAGCAPNFGAQLARRAHDNCLEYAKDALYDRSAWFADASAEVDRKADIVTVNFKLVGHSKADNFDYVEEKAQCIVDKDGKVTSFVARNPNTHKYEPISELERFHKSYATCADGCESTGRGHWQRIQLDGAGRLVKCWCERNDP